MLTHDQQADQLDEGPESLANKLAECERQLEDSQRQVAVLAAENKTLREDFQDLFEEAPIPYVHEALDSRFIRANRAAMQVLGVTAADIVTGTYGNTLVA